MRAAASSPQPFNPLVLAAIGTLVFLNVYTTQALLPLLAREFGAGPVALGWTVGATTLAMALAAPLAGLIADAAGRQRLIALAFGLLTLPAVWAVSSGSLQALTAARFAQGLLIPLVMVAANAYAAEESPPGRVARTITAYVTGTVLGGFLGRFLAGAVASRFDWHGAFWLLAATNLLGAGLTLALLPRERGFTANRNVRVALADLATHLRNSRLMGSALVGFTLLFALVAPFTFITLRLDAPPYALGSAALGSVYAVYLLGVLVTPLAGRLLERVGPGAMLRVAAALSLTGLALTLTTPLWLIVLGLALASCGVFAGQAAALNAVQRSVTRARSLAGGLYNLLYYAGGATASFVGGLTYASFAWPGVAALSAAAMVGAAVIGSMVWIGFRREEERG